MAKPVHVALLRGINVGGKHRLPMRDLGDALGFAVPIVHRTRDALAAALAANPFLAEDPDPKRLHVGPARSSSPPPTRRDCPTREHHAR